MYSQSCSRLMPLMGHIRFYFCMVLFHTINNSYYCDWLAVLLIAMELYREYGYDINCKFDYNLNFLYRPTICATSFIYKVEIKKKMIDFSAAVHIWKPQIPRIATRPNCRTADPNHELPISRKNIYLLSGCMLKIQSTSYLAYITRSSHLTDWDWQNTMI